MKKTIIQLKKRSKFKILFKYVATHYFKDAYTKRKESTIYSESIIFSYETEYIKYIKTCFEQKDINI